MPNQISKELIEQLLNRNITIIAQKELYDSNAVIQYIRYSNDNQATNLIFESSDDLAKTISNRQIHRHCYVKKSGVDNKIDKEINRYGDIESLVDVGRGKKSLVNKNEFFEDDSAMICCLNHSNSPIKYDENFLLSECIKISNLKTSSSDIISYGPIVSNLHKDLTYSKRISYIDRNNTGTVKIWIISISSATRMNKLISIDKHKLTPSDVIKHIIFKFPQNFQILIQRPGDMIIHEGKCYHMVITIINPIVNKSGICFSFGRRFDDLTNKVASAKDNRFNGYIADSNGRLKRVSPNVSLKASLGKVLGLKIIKQIEEGKKQKASLKSKKGFQKGNNLASKLGNQLKIKRTLKKN